MRSEIGFHGDGYRVYSIFTSTGLNPQILYVNKLKELLLPKSLHDRTKHDISKFLLAQVFQRNKLQVVPPHVIMAAILQYLIVAVLLSCVLLLQPAEARKTKHEDHPDCLCVF